MPASIRLNKQEKTIKVVNRRSNIRLTHTRSANLKLQHTGKTGPASNIPGPAGIGVPTGGQTGQVLQKETNDDYDFKWMTPTFEDKNYVTNFPVSSVVTVEHNLMKYPSVTVLDSAGDEVEGTVTHENTQRLILTFSAPFSGTVTCN